LEPVAQVDQSGTTSLHSDHLYTPRLGTNELQSTVWQWESEVFGNAEPQVEATEVNLRFLGQYRDEESRLYYNWNRYYDPETGRYVTSDPIGLNGGMNTYGYAMVNPNIYTDPTGEVVPALVACALNPVCARAVRAGVGALIGGLSAFAAAVNDPCFNGDLLDVAGSGAFVGGLSSFVPGAGGLAGATLRGGLAGGNAAGQLFVNGGINNFNIIQTSVAGVVGGASLAGGNILGFNAALHAARGGAGTAQALAIGESTGSAVGTAVGASATLAEIGLNQNSGECGCSNP